MSIGRRVLLGSGFIVAVAGAAGVAVGIWRSETESHDVAAVADLFALTLADAGGTPRRLAQWRGRTLVVNFWATWCAPCVEEMPELQRLREEYRARGVDVIGLGIDSAANIRQFRDDHGLTLPLLVAGAEGSGLGARLGNTAGALPYTVLITREGRVAQRKLGRIRPDELRRWLDAQPGFSG